MSSSASEDGSEYNPDQLNGDNDTYEQPSPVQPQSHRKQNGKGGRGTTGGARGNGTQATTSSHRRATSSGQGMSSMVAHPHAQPSGGHGHGYPPPPPYGTYQPASPDGSSHPATALESRDEVYHMLRNQTLFHAQQPNSVGDGSNSHPQMLGMGFIPLMPMNPDAIPASHPAEAPPGETSGHTPPQQRTGGSRKRPEPGSEEWARMRKDNHKEVERRRRGNINDGITELGKLIPPSNGDKAKGAILHRAVDYMRQLKESEQRQIDKWTMEKLQMDKMYSELQNRLNEAEQRYESERERRIKAETELRELKERDGDRPTKRPRLE